MLERYSDSVERLLAYARELEARANRLEFADHAKPEDWRKAC